ncbi:hypothetical protein GGR56DRAFT_322368 [Xylariaceae sp. FL0804]|nr:hypothetical protein GGR56DRAFT_322368 [Xylariaceae sp. FL0804]
MMGTTNSLPSRNLQFANPGDNHQGRTTLIRALLHKNLLLTSLGIIRDLYLYSYTLHHHHHHHHRSHPHRAHLSVHCRRNRPSEQASEQAMIVRYRTFGATRQWSGPSGIHASRAPYPRLEEIKEDCPAVRRRRRRWLPADNLTSKLSEQTDSFTYTLSTPSFCQYVRHYSGTRLSLLTRMRGFHSSLPPLSHSLLVRLAPGGMSFKLQPAYLHTKTDPAGPGSLPTKLGKVVRELCSSNYLIAVSWDHRVKRARI